MMRQLQEAFYSNVGALTPFFYWLLCTYNARFNITSPMHMRQINALRSFLIWKRKRRNERPINSDTYIILEISFFNQVAGDLLNSRIMSFFIMKKSIWPRLASFHDFIFVSFRWPSNDPRTIHPLPIHHYMFMTHPTCPPYILYNPNLYYIWIVIANLPTCMSWIFVWNLFMYSY